MTARLIFRAPSHNREILAVPEFARVPPLIQANQLRLSSSTLRLDGLTLRDLRALARREVLELCKDEAGAFKAASGALVVTGHQPELSHPGVWVKNFAINGLATRLDGIALNLIVDNDTLKSTALHLPVYDQDDPSLVRLESLSFDAFQGEVAYEDCPIRDLALFRSLPQRAAALLRNWDFEPLLSKVWREEGTVERSFVSMRRERELAWGCRNLEVRVSDLCDTDAFRHFARHICNDLERFREVYNQALQTYREENGLRSVSHPAPDLQPGEAPFWVRGSGSTRARATTSCDLGSLRPRALTLTLFARVCLGDYFIHGIGGGKYDEVTDRIIENYLGIAPPHYQVLSGTLHLPFRTFVSDEDDREEASRKLRDLHWNPQRHLASSEFPIQRLLERKNTLIASEPPRGNHAARRKWFRELLEVTERLRPWVAKELPAAREALGKIELEVNANSVLRRRDYAWVFHPEATLRPFLQQFLSPG